MCQNPSFISTDIRICIVYTIKPRSDVYCFKLNRIGPLSVYKELGQKDSTEQNRSSCLKKNYRITRMEVDYSGRSGRWKVDYRSSILIL